MKNCTFEQQQVSSKSDNSNRSVDYLRFYFVQFLMFVYLEKYLGYALGYLQISNIRTQMYCYVWLHAKCSRDFLVINQLTSLGMVTCVLLVGSLPPNIIPCWPIPP